MVQAEQFKAAVEQPKGMFTPNLDQFVLKQDLEQFLRTLVDNEDDEFFHLTCHVDLPLRQKIEQGEFVELEKLLPRTHAQVVSDDQKMHFVNWDGASFWVPAERESRITGIRKWDQAFRIYAAIYSKHNPNRSAEIWQYIHVINMAAVSYI